MQEIVEKGSREGIVEVKVPRCIHGFVVFELGPLDQC
jgi:hypothetical protein